MNECDLTSGTPGALPQTLFALGKTLAVSPRATQTTPPAAPQIPRNAW